MTVLRRLLLAGLLPLTLAALVPAADADAGTFTVWSCRGPEGAPAPTVAWQAGGTAGTTADDCAAGGALRATLGQADADGDAISGFGFVLPPGATIAGYRAWMAATVAPTTPTPLPADQSSYAAGLSETDGLGVHGFRTGCLAAPAGCTWGVPGAPDDPANLTQDGTTLRGLAIAVRCATPAGCSATQDPAGTVDLYRSAVDVRDDEAPTVGVLGGPLLDGPVTGRQVVAVPASDVGGGVARVEARVDGRLVAAADSGGACVPPYAAAAPCPLATERSLVVDTAALAPGPHQLVARAIDPAGNATDGAPTSFVVAAPVPNPPPVVPTPTPEPARRVVLRLPERITLPERSRTRGVARWADGTPAAGVTLEVRARPFGDPVARGTRVARVRTSSSGRFTLPRTRESRILRVTPADDGVTGAAEETELVARLGLRLTVPSRAVRNGRVATFRGRVTGAGGAGIPVDVQAIVRGRWSTVGTVETTSRGTVVWKYRFTNTRRRAEYRFRLVAAASRQRPWRRTVSARRIVRVLP
ncbi:hypothetical protein [Patulibacter sp. SYSU D01012]|uniref:hypothetical protein n=1 Tax=Patulibacter sp. SYSU D01012 TaxID=2817381 RepID=UPI001B30D1D7|nr:hypothetical protein [Patulibacter sp. SYSU D01012]